MRVRIEESFLGELEGLTLAGQLLRAEEAVQKAVLDSAPIRGGEVDLILDLGRELGEKYSARMQRLAADYAEMLLEGDDT